MAVLATFFISQLSKTRLEELDDKPQKAFLPAGDG